MFDKIVVPVLFMVVRYGVFKALIFLKYIFNLKSSTPNYMVYGETGRFPLYVTAYTRMICYWSK